jgi:flagellar basal body rod protein FlgG
MIPALYSASSGMQAQQLNLDTIANNLANVNTTGFKKTRVDFQELLYQTFRAPGLQGTQGTIIPTGIQVGLGARPVATQRIFSQGDFQSIRSTSSSRATASSRSSGLTAPPRTAVRARSRRMAPAGSSPRTVEC